MGGVRFTDAGADQVGGLHTRSGYRRRRRQAKRWCSTFTANWCLNCKALEEHVLKDPQVAALLARPEVAALKVDLSGDNRAGSELLGHSGRSSMSIPWLMISGPDGTVRLASEAYTVAQVHERAWRRLVRAENRAMIHRYSWVGMSAGILLLAGLGGCAEPRVSGGSNATAQSAARHAASSKGATIGHAKAKLQAMGLALPAAPKPIAVYVPAVRTGNYIFISGQLPFKDGKLLATGPVPSNATLEQAQGAARQCALNCLAILDDQLGGDWNRFVRVVRVGAFVNSDASFTDQPKVANGASELLGQILGEAGRHARAAVGVNTLPLGASVEVEMLVEVK